CGGEPPGTGLAGACASRTLPSIKRKVTRMMSFATMDFGKPEFWTRLVCHGQYHSRSKDSHSVSQSGSKSRLDGLMETGAIRHGWPNPDCSQMTGDSDLTVAALSDH